MKKGRSNGYNDYIIGHVGYSTAFCGGKCGLCVVVVCKNTRPFPLPGEKGLFLVDYKTERYERQIIYF